VGQQTGKKASYSGPLFWVRVIAGRGRGLLMRMALSINEVSLIITGEFARSYGRCATNFGADGENRIDRRGYHNYLFCIYIGSVFDYYFALASNTQIAANIGRTKRSGKRIRMGIFAAIVLVTLPVLPLKFLGIPGPDFDFSNVTDMGRHLVDKVRSGLQGRMDTRQAAAEHATIGSSDVRLLDDTASALLAESAKHPNDPGLHNRLGLIYAELGELDLAVSHFEQAIKSSRAEIKALRVKASSARAAGNATKASQQLLAISELTVQLAAAHSSLQRTYEQLGKSDRVIAQIEELNRDVKLAGALKAEHAAKTAGSGTAIGASKLDAKSAAILARASSYRQAGRLADAMAEYKLLTEVAPNLAVAHKELGFFAISMQDNFLAQEELSRAAALDPDDAIIHSTLGAVYMTLGKREEAIDQFNKALVLNPKEGLAAFNLGNIYADMGQIERARKAYEKAVTIKPDSAFARNNLATMCSMSGDFKTAAEEFKKTIQFAPNMASAHYGLGVALMQLRDYRGSEMAFKHALHLNPGLVDAQNRMEIAHKKASLNHHSMHVN